ncbi:NAD(P)H-dependent oxidoreductase [Aliidiomarina halalkaliphila]|uniref:NAD(P)H-dependent oxidoreductase n=1 Tax=Aliidiomarina halalkaliphila TaxID=2593535 RepID=A0A552X1C5_9GAMM|nr:NAD(P)H-dependent oxidoreductase [Aliidiomarina halalkaliphila]TRW48679.1 NAD(P)H-dependent oxidoreductase [Aliidiomarina halalkaliphila]
MKLLVFAGSLRKASLNRKLAKHIARAAEAEGCEVIYLDLNDYPLPVYNGDIEDQGMPENVHRLQELMRNADGFLISTPEYNGAVPAVVKNTLDWMSRKQKNGDSGGQLFQAKVAGICSASPGALGGLRALLLLRDQLAKLGMWVAPTQFALSKASEQFHDDDSLKSDHHERILAVIRSVMSFHKSHQ